MQIEKGRQKYDVELSTLNGRCAYTDFLQEQVDGLMYATQLYLEARTFISLLAESMRLFRQVERSTNGITTDDGAVAAWAALRHHLEEASQCLERSGLVASVSESPASST